MLGALPFAASPLSADAPRALDAAIAAGRLGLPLPAGIDDARSRVILRLVDWIDDRELGPLLVMRLPSVSGDVLLPLAWQEDLLGLGGWSLAVDDAARRTLLLNAILTHRIRGTPAAVRQSLIALGWPAAAVADAVTARYHDGSFARDGRYRRDGGRRWPGFGVSIGAVADAQELSLTTLTTIVGTVELWQNARSLLEEVVGVIDLTPGTVLTAVGAALTAEQLVAQATHVGVGSSGTPATAADVGLVTPFLRHLFGAVVSTPGHAAFEVRFDADQANDLVIREFGLLDGAGALLARKVRGAIAKTAPFAIEATWTITAGA